LRQREQNGPSPTLEEIRARGREDWLKLRNEHTPENSRDPQDRSAERNQAFDLNPFPDKGRDPKTWLTEETGPTGKIEAALRAASYFHLTDEGALRILGEVHGAVSRIP
jgi:hypothetical protein